MNIVYYIRAIVYFYKRVLEDLKIRYITYTLDHILNYGTLKNAHKSKANIS